MAHVLLPPPSARTRDAALLRGYARTRDPELRRRLVERYLPLARHLAIRIHHGSEPLEDLVQVAALGLLKALDRFDPDRGTAFTSFATPTIRGELQRHLRDRTWALRPPRALQEDALRVAAGIETLTARLDRSPTVGELADHLDLEEAEVLEAMQASSRRSLPSLDAPAAGPDSSELHEHVGVVDAGYERAEDRAELDRLWSVLSPRDRAILRLRFHDDLTQAEIGQRLGLSQMHVSRLLRRAVGQLREAAGVETTEAAARRWW